MTMPNEGKMSQLNEKKLLCLVDSRSFTSAFTLEQSLSQPEASLQTSYPSMSLLFYSSRNLYIM